ncbi:MAG: hypothetical protein U5R49_09110 [Deltaproteobacteria bacterium]|nr:hypothetical protein [Deltaproteobacteria bacterium]
MADDLLEREAVLSGEIEVEEADLAVLSVSQATDAEPLPSFLISDDSAGREASRHGPAVDVIWGAYFSHAAGVAERLASRFLGQWVAYEVGLRNTMVRIRAETLGLDPGPYLIVEELGKSHASFSRELDEWKRAPNPLEGLESLERSRWKWVTEHEPWYEFTDDEVVAYGAKLLVLIRWHRITREKTAGKNDAV